MHPCANCGAPAPLALAHPSEVVCPYCGARAPLPADLAWALAGAAAALEAQAKAERHIAAAVLRIAERERWWLGRMLAIWLRFAAISFIIMAWAWLTRLEDDGWHGYFLFGAATGTLTGVLSALVAWKLPLRIRAMVGRYTALKLEGRGRLRCRSCGGPLPEGDAAVTRCDFCSADNFVDAAVTGLVARAGHAVRSLAHTSARTQAADEAVALLLVALPAAVLNRRATVRLPTRPRT